METGTTGWNPVKLANGKPPYFYLKKMAPISLAGWILTWFFWIRLKLKISSKSSFDEDLSNPSLSRVIQKDTSLLKALDMTLVVFLRIREEGGVTDMQSWPISDKEQLKGGIFSTYNQLKTTHSSLNVLMLEHGFQSIWQELSPAVCTSSTSCTGLQTRRFVWNQIRAGKVFVDLVLMNFMRIQLSCEIRTHS